VKNLTFTVLKVFRGKWALKQKNAEHLSGVFHIFNILFI